MSQQFKKMIAPIVITLLIIIYFTSYIFLGLSLANEMPLMGRILLVLIPTSFIMLSISMLIERINEIKEGEDDDLSKY